MKSTDIEITSEMLQAAFNASFEECSWLEDPREVCIEAVIRAALSMQPRLIPVLELLAR